MENDNGKLKVKGAPVNLLIAGGAFILMIILQSIITMNFSNFWEATEQSLDIKRLIIFYFFSIITIIFSIRSVKSKESRVGFFLIGLVLIPAVCLGALLTFSFIMGLGMAENSPFN